MHVGSLLRDARSKRGLGQAELARRAGTTQTYISRVERGTVSPSLATLARLFGAMGQRLELSVQPLSHGNAIRSELQASWQERSAQQRVDEAVELSMFLTQVAADSARGVREQG